MFADVAHILNTGKGNCVKETARVSQTVSDSYPNYDDTDPFCSSDFKDSYLRFYTIVLGEFDFSSYVDNRYMEAIFIIFTAMVVIVLMTSLTALVIDSYNESKLNAKFAYGRVRVDLAAEQVAFIKQLEEGTCRRTEELKEYPSRKCFKKLCYIFYRYCVLIEICSAIGITFSSLVFRFFDSFKGHDADPLKRKVFNVPFMLVMFVIMIVSLIVILDFMFQGCIGSCLSCLPIYQKVHNWKSNFRSSAILKKKKFGCFLKKQTLMKKRHVM